MNFSRRGVRINKVSKNQDKIIFNTKKLKKFNMKLLKLPITCSFLLKSILVIEEA